MGGRGLDACRHNFQCTWTFVTTGGRCRVKNKATFSAEFWTRIFLRFLNCFFWSLQSNIKRSHTKVIDGQYKHVFLNLCITQPLQIQFSIWMMISQYSFYRFYCATLIWNFDVKLYTASYGLFFFVKVRWFLYPPSRFRLYFNTFYKLTFKWPVIM